MKKFSKSFLILMTIALLSFTLSGCIGVNRQFTFMKDDLLGQLSNDYQTEVQFSVGPLALQFSSVLVAMADDEHEYTDDMLREITSVQVGVYKNEGSRIKEKYPASFNEKMNRNGWKAIVKNYDNGETTFIYINDDLSDGIKKLFVVSLNEEELVMVEVQGDLKEVIAYAVAEKEFELAME